jgi:hypothetical protein
LGLRSICKSLASKQIFGGRRPTAPQIPTGARVIWFEPLFSSFVTDFILLLLS